MKKIFSRSPSIIKRNASPGLAEYETFIWSTDVVICAPLVAHNIAFDDEIGGSEP